VHGLCAAVYCSALSTVVGFISDYIVTYSVSAAIVMTILHIRVHRFASINLNNIICYATSHRLHQTTHCNSFCMLVFPSTLTCTQLTATAAKCCPLPARITHCSFAVRVYCKCCGAPVPEYCSRNLRSCSLYILFVVLSMTVHNVANSIMYIINIKVSNFGLVLFRFCVNPLLR
jgi:hypothetical protein